LLLEKQIETQYLLTASLKFTPTQEKGLSPVHNGFPINKDYEQLFLAKILIFVRKNRNYTPKPGCTKPNRSA